MYSPLKNFIFVSIKKYRYACFYLLCKDHGSALLCCRARSHSPEIRNGGCAECVGNVAVFSIRIGKASSGEYQNCCREPFEHLRITSFLYGLLRPLDGIKPYRLEGDVRLPEKGGISMFDYWKPLLTDYFIEEIKNCGGVLINLASAEMKDLFDWKRVEQEVRVITPEFQVWKAGQPKTVVIYAKMCRGEMTRFIVKNRLECPEELKSFSWEGFVWDEIRSTENVWHFSLGTFM